MNTVEKAEGDTWVFKVFPFENLYFLFPWLYLFFTRKLLHGCLISFQFHWISYHTVDSTKNKRAKLLKVNCRMRKLTTRTYATRTKAAGTRAVQKAILRRRRKVFQWSDGWRKKAGRFIDRTFKDRTSWTARQVQRAKHERTDADSMKLPADYDSRR